MKACCLYTVLSYLLVGGAAAQRPRTERQLLLRQCQPGCLNFHNAATHIGCEAGLGCLADIGGDFTGGLPGCTFGLAPETPIGFCIDPADIPEKAMFVFLDSLFDSDSVPPPGSFRQCQGGCAIVGEEVCSTGVCYRESMGEVPGCNGFNAGMGYCIDAADVV